MMVSYKKIIVAALFAFVSVVVVGMLAPSTAHAFGSGDGTGLSPYEVTSCADLLDVDDFLSSAFILTADLDCTANGNDAMIGSSTGVFTGTFDGQQHSIKIHISTTDDDVGLFASVNDTLIINLSVLGSVHGNHNVGGIVGHMVDSTIERVMSAVAVEGTSYGIGGIVGDASDSFINDVYYTGSVSSSDGQVGGIAGSAGNTTISRVYSAGTVQGTNEVGGVVGTLYEIAGTALIDDSFFAGYIKAGGYSVGGVVGYNDGGETANASYDATIADIGSASIDCFGVSNNSTNDCTPVNDDGGTPGYYKTTSTNEPIASWNINTGANPSGIWYLHAGALPTLFDWTPAPAITSLSSTVGSPDGGESLGITGVGFAVGTVSFDGDAASIVDTGDTTGIEVETPAHAVGEVPLIVTNSDGQVTIARFTYVDQTSVFAGGDGSMGDPYQINSCAGITAMNDHLAAFFIVTSDLDCTGNGNDIMVGGDGTPFTGTFDGGGHTVIVDIEDAGDYTGLFRRVEGAVIKNIRVGGTVSGAISVGGLVGDALDTTFDRVASMVHISATGFNLGGIVGTMRHGTMANAYFTGTLAGYGNGVSTSDQIGGIAGVVNEGTITNAYSAGTIESNGGSIGGLVGELLSDPNPAEVSHSFFVGYIKEQGIFIGVAVGSNNDGTVSDIYYDDTETDAGWTGSLECVGNGTAGSCTPVNTDGTDTAHFLSSAANEPIASWDIYNASTHTSGAWYLHANGLPTLFDWTPPPSVLDTNPDPLSPDGGDDLVFDGTYFHIGTVSFDGVNQSIEDTNADNQIEIITVSHTAGIARVLITNQDGQVATYFITFATDDPMETYPFTSGDGGGQDPYEIDSCEALQAIGATHHDGGSYFYLSGDLTCENFNPINDPDDDVVNDTTFDGRGHTLTLTMGASTLYAGLFQNISDSYIHDLRIAGDISSESNATGAIAGYANDSTAERVWITANVSGGNNVGGVFGESHGTTSIIDSLAAGDVTAYGSNAGGLIGNAEGGFVHTSYSIAHVTGNDLVGGLVGRHGVSELELDASFADGVVTSGGEYTGGLVGQLNVDQDSISNSWYSTGNTGMDHCATAIGEGPYVPTEGDGVVCHTTDDGDYFENNLVNAPLDTWDFEAVWEVTDGYPRLRSIIEAVPDTTPPTVETTSLVQGATDVALDTSDVAFAFSEPIDFESLEITMGPCDSVCPTFEVAGEGHDINVHITSPQPLVAGVTYTITLAHVEDQYGNVMSPYILSFTTIDPPSHHHGGGGGGGSTTPPPAQVPSLSVIPILPPPTDCLPGYTFSPTTGRSCVGSSSSRTQSSQLISSSPSSTTTAASPTSCSRDLYPTEPIKLGAINDPAQVRLLEQYLNTYEGFALPVDGVYSIADRDAVVQWQEKYAKEILTPWHATKGTGYVFTTSLQKIKQHFLAQCQTVIPAVVPIAPTLGTPGQCAATLLITQNMRAPSRDGTYDRYTGGIVREIKILQAHLNRLGFASGAQDGILGTITNGAIKRMQVYLGTKPDGLVGPITRSLINNSCGAMQL